MKDNVYYKVGNVIVYINRKVSCFYGKKKYIYEFIYNYIYEFMFFMKYDFICF